MRILIYGAGVIGSIFAGKLCSSGNDVTVLARNEKFNRIKKEGLKLNNIYTKKLETYNVNVIDELRSDDIYDYILVTMQFQQVDNILPILEKNKSENIVFFVNNPSGYDKWKQCMGKRMLVGFPACGGETIDGITNYYIVNGLIGKYQITTFGEIDGTHTDRLNSIVKAFKNAGISCAISNNIDSWQKTHVAIIVPVANAIYKNSGNIKLLADNNPDLKLMIRGIREGLSSLKELGYSVEPGSLNLFYMPIWFLALVYRFAFKSKIADFSMARHANKAKNETIELQKSFELLIKETKNYKDDIYELSKYSKE
ncbi:ketopantoate reductase family protein [Clostridium sp. JS66]|uniref:ketopantoate reductase family protein n=1 Tax=Clostridium sp. JS66 TaxID=3064705 RepID=UPI00298EA7B2|nr:2-dehydropantoate 2-reductase N-terminal domain-containing protein [Clostridium sp. JS66]WPC42734.1 2-dehydropantoate 2-reductase N-terminal domain-containing protein [Clostridium sp. JS66]